MAENTVDDLRAAFGLDAEPQEEQATEPVQEQAPVAQPVEDKAPDEVPATEPIKDEPKAEDAFGYNKEAGEDTGEVFDEQDYDAETEKQIAGLDPKQGEAWRKLRSQAKEGKTLSREMEALKTELEAAREQARQVDEMQERVKQITERNYRIEVESSDEWRQKVEAPSAEAGATLDRLADDYGISTNKLIEIMREESTKARTHMLNELFPDVDADDEPLPLNSQHRLVIEQEISRAATTYKKALQDREALLANAKARHDELQAKRAEELTKAQEQELKQRRTHIDSWVRKYESKFGDEFAEDLKAQLKPVASIPWEQMSVSDQTQALTGGAAVPVLLSKITALETELTDYRMKDGKDRSATPNVSAGVSAGDKSDASNNDLDWKGAMDKYFG